MTHVVAGCQVRAEFPCAQAPFGPPPPWASPSPLTSAELEKQRVEFWATYGSGAYGGDTGTLCAVGMRAALTGAR